jgi:hypothetical protein
MKESLVLHGAFNFEALDYDLTKLDGGGPAGSDHINPANLPLRKVGGTCQPVYPNQYLKNDTTTIMEVIHAAGKRGLVGQAPGLSDHQRSLRQGSR